jgi:hypothetical protein
MKFYFNTIGCICLLWSCGGGGDKSTDFGTGSDDTGESGTDTALAGVQGQVVLSPRDKALDLVVDADTLYYSTQYDPAVFSWDPASGVEEKIAWDYRDLTAFTVSGGRFWGSFSDSGIEGWVSEIQPPKGEEEWASQGVNGTLFRRPGDLAFFQGGLVFVDTKLNVVWKVDDQGQATQIAENQSILCLAVVAGDLIYGGEGGVFTQAGEELDARSVFALGVIEGKAFGIHSTDGFFPVGENKSWKLLGPPRPGAFAFYQGALFSVDEVGGAIWRFDLEM